MFIHVIGIGLGISTLLMRWMNEQNRGKTESKRARGEDDR